MNCKMILLAVSAALMLSACNEQKAESKTADDAVASAQVAKTHPVATVSEAAAPKPASATIAEKISMVEWKDALEMAKNGAVFVDVRNPQELKDGFVYGAIRIPLPELKERFSELPKDKDLLIYCRSGRRSEVATHFLMTQGYEKAHNVLGGFLAYPHEK